MPTKPPDGTHSIPASRFDQHSHTSIKPQTSASSATRPIRILVLSDTHSASPHESTSPFAYRHALPSADLLIHAGDLTRTSRYEEHLTTYNVLATHPAEVKLVIPGNHDLSLDDDYFVTRGQLPRGVPSPNGLIPRKQFWEKCMRLWTGEEARQKGIVMCINEGPVEVVVGGTLLKIYASPYTPEFCNWAFAYPRPINESQHNETLRQHEDRFSSPSSPSYVPEGIDLLVSHGPPGTILDEVIGRTPGSVGCVSLLAAVRRTKPLLHVFGHIHEAYGVQRVDWLKEDGLGKGERWLGRNWDLCQERVDGERRGVNLINVSSRKAMKDADEKFDTVIDGPVLRRGQETLFVNAAIMSRLSEPKNSPWVVDLDVPIRSQIDGVETGTPKAHM